MLFNHVHKRVFYPPFFTFTVSTVATDALVLKHQIISIHNADTNPD